MQKTRRMGLSPAAWMVLVVLTAVAAWLVFEVGASAAPGVPQPVAGSAASGSVMVVAGKVARDTYGLYMVDLDKRTICVYESLAGTGKLRLVAARTYAYDRELDEYNTEPSPREIRKLVGKARRLEEPADRRRSGAVSVASKPAVGSAAGGSVTAVAGQVTRDTYGLYLVDRESRTICMYQWLAKQRKLKMVAARTYTFDCKLDEYETEPSLLEIREIARKARSLKAPATRPK